LKALLKGLSHLFASLNAHLASLAGSDALIEELTSETQREGRMSIIALEGWAQVVSHEMETFHGKAFSFHLRDLGAAAHERKALFEQLICRGRPLMQANESAAAGSSFDGAAAAAAWLEALVGDDCELVGRCAHAMPVLLVFQDGSSCSALHVAAASGSNRVVDLLLSRGASLYSRDCWNRLPVHTLCIGAALSEYALRRQQAKMKFVDAFVGLELDGRVPCNDNAARIMAGKENDSANDNCWLRCFRRMLQYSGKHAADVALSVDDKGLSCAQYAAAADAVMQLGLLQLLLQCAAEDAGGNSWLMLRQHKQQLQLTSKCLGHAAALQFVTEFLGQIEEQGKGRLIDPATRLQLQHTRPETTKQRLVLRTAEALQALSPETVEHQEAASHDEVLEAEEPCTPASDPREEIVKFRQRII
jgi:ankyrin repeat protein